MVAYTLGMLYFRQRKTFFLIYSHYIKNYIEHFLLFSRIQPLSCISYILLHSTAPVVHDLFLHSLQVLPNQKRRGGVRVSYYKFKKRYSFKTILNDIPFVNIFLIFLTNLCFEMKIRNNYRITTVQKMAAGLYKNLRINMKQKQFLILDYLQSCQISLYLYQSN